MTQTSAKPDNHQNKVMEQKQLVSEMTRCDQENSNEQSTYECYMKATRKIREHNDGIHS